MIKAEVQTLRVAMIRDGTKSFSEYFKKRPEPKELVRKWQADIRTEQRQIEKSIRQVPKYICMED